METEENNLYYYEDFARFRESEQEFGQHFSSKLSSLKLQNGCTNHSSVTCLSYFKTA